MLRSQLDTRGIMVSRPTEHEGGGKRIYRLIYGNLRAAITEKSELTHNPESRSDSARDIVKFRIPYRDLRGNTLDIDRGDAIGFIDYRGQEKQVIVFTVRAIKRALGRRIDHLHVEAEG